MMVRLRKQHCLLISLPLTGFLLFLVFNVKPLPQTKPVDGEGEVGFLRRRIANDDSVVGTVIDTSPNLQLKNSSQNTAVKDSNTPYSSTPHHTPIHLTEGARKNLAKEGILLVEDDEDDVIPNDQPQIQESNPHVKPEKHPEQRTDAEQHLSENGIQHKQWLKQVEVQHQEFLKQQHKLQDQHLLQTHVLQQRVQREEQQKQQQKNNRIFPAMAPVTYESLKKQGEMILQHMLKREFLNVDKDSSFTPGEIVEPSQVRRVIIVSTWRSGSTYLGDLLRAYPGTFLSFEPLHQLLKNQHFQEGPMSEKVLDLLRGILTCDYSNLDEYVNYMRNNTFLMDHNIRLWNSCIRNRALCFDREYLSKICKYMPVNVLKTVRMGLSPVVELLQDPSLDLRVIHLIRDPRGSLHSRMQLSWCHSQTCSDPETVCRDLLADLNLSDWLKQSFPDRYLLIRYEDMGLQPELKAREIFKFLHLSYNKYVTTFVKEHTTPSRKTKKNGTYSTFRDSRATTFAWRGALNYTSVDAIQDVCVEPLQRLKLRIFQSEEDYLNTTIPVLLNP